MQKQIITLTVSMQNNPMFDETLQQVNKILAKVGCKGGYSFVSETTLKIRFNLEFLTLDEVEMTIGRFIMAGFQVQVLKDENA